MLLKRTAVVFGMLLLLNLGRAAQNDPCATTSTVSDMRLALALKDGGAIFEQGAIVPMVLSFTSTAKHRYWADDRNYDRSGRLDIEYYCVEPEALDPLESYFKFGAFIGGGLGGTRELTTTPFVAEAELNEWRRLQPGHYRVYAISYRVWRPPDPREKTPYGRVSEIVRSNTVEFDVKQPDSDWQSDQLRSAMQTLAGSASPEEARRAARRLRFLNTKESTRQLAKMFCAVNQHQSADTDLMFGLYGSPYRQLTIDSMRAELAAPDHAITNQFLVTLINLQVSADRSWDSPPIDPASAEEAQAFWTRV